MNKIKSVAFSLLVISHSACVSEKPLLQNEDVMDAVLRDIIIEDRHKEIVVANKFRKWSIGVDIDFNIPGEHLPLTDEERKSRLESELIDPYKIWYVFAYPITDTLFDSEDRKFISVQMKDTSQMFFQSSLEKVKLVEPKAGEIHGYYFSKPVFDKRYRYAIIRKYENYSITEDGTLFGSSQTLYYRFDKDKGWVRIFATPVWL